MFLKNLNNLNFILPYIILHCFTTTLQFYSTENKQKNQPNLINFTKVSKLVSRPRFRYRSLITMNNKKSVTLDVIVIYDNSLFSILQAMTAKQYFENRGQLFRDNQYSMTICTWDILPGKASDNYRLKIGPKAVAIIVFASYENETQPHRLILSASMQNIMILLNEKTILVAENGLDYMNIGSKKEFTVMEEIIESNSKIIDNNIPSGYGNFYELDYSQEPPAIIEDPKLKYKDPKVTQTQNIPVRVEEGSNFNENHTSYHANNNTIYVKKKFINFFNFMEDKLGDKLFTNTGIMDDNILKKHSIAFVYEYETQPKETAKIIEIFIRNKYNNFIILSQFNRMLYGGRDETFMLDNSTNKNNNSDKNEINNSNINSKNGNKKIGGNNTSANGDINNNNDNNGGNNNNSMGFNSNNNNSANNKNDPDKNSNNPLLDKIIDGKNQTQASDNEKNKGNSSDTDKNSSKGQLGNLNIPKNNNNGSTEDNSLNKTNQNEKASDQSNTKSAEKKSVVPSNTLSKMGSLSNGLSKRFSLLNLLRTIGRVGSNVARRKGVRYV